jgi:hypothetical protein
MKILSKLEMEKLPTKRLLSYKARLLRVGDGSCDCGSSGFDYTREMLLEDGVFIKSSPLWQELYANVKDVLNGREHIEKTE